VSCNIEVVAEGSRPVDQVYPQTMDPYKRFLLALHVVWSNRCDAVPKV
jgi:hypothetical protein